MNPPRVSVIVCTHNPRLDYLARTLAALRAQSLPLDAWELLVIDNASREPVAARCDLSWHPQGRVVVESQLGLTKARLRGIAESRGEVLVFVDDDNVLDPAYLTQALAIADTKPFIGAWGGRVQAEFETSPPAWLRPYFAMFALNPVPRDAWSNSTELATATAPCGAGMCVRRIVAATWAAAIETDPRRLALGRAGSSLASCEDQDLAFTACDLGLAAGLFTSLRLIHIIPKERLTLDYAARLVEAIATSQVFLRSLREEVPPETIPRWGQRLLWQWTRLRMDKSLLRLQEAHRRGHNRGFELLKAQGAASRAR